MKGITLEIWRSTGVWCNRDEYVLCTQKEYMVPPVFLTVIERAERT